MSEEYTVATEEELEYERALAMLKADRDAWEADCLALQAQNRDLLAALEVMLDGCSLTVAALSKRYGLPKTRFGWDDPHDVWWSQVKDQARAAIAAAKETK